MTDDKSPRLMGRKDAAKYCGIGESTFSLWVSTHKMPPAIPGYAQMGQAGDRFTVG